MKELVIINEPEQLESIVAYVTARPTPPVVVPLSVWIERSLGERGVSAESFEAYYPPWTDFSGLLTEVQDIAREWYRLPELSFFKHEDLAIGEMLEGGMWVYLQVARYYLWLLEQIYAKHPDLTRLVVPQTSGGLPRSAGPFALYEIQMVEKAVAWFGKLHGIEVEVLGAVRTVDVDPFPQLPKMKSLALGAYNKVMGLFASPSAKTLFASDYWKNLEPVLDHMPEAELILMDRKELSNIPWKKLWQHRVRFLHPLDMMSSDVRREARTKQEEFKNKWQSVKRVVAQLPGFTFGGGNWFSLVEEGFDALFGVHAQRVVADIIVIKKILQTQHINHVLLRASASGQQHFYILGHLAPRFGAHSFELQHGIGIGTANDPGSIYARLQAEYLFAYGPVTRDAFVRNQHIAPERIIPVGSPRFDRYIEMRDAFGPAVREQGIRALGLSPEKPLVCVIMCDEIPLLIPAVFSSAEFCDHITLLKDILRVLPDAQFALKFRSDYQRSRYEAFVKETFPDGNVVCYSEDAFSLVLLSDVVYACNSTLSVESMIANKPVILFPVKAWDVYFLDLVKEGGISVAALTPDGVQTCVEVVAHTTKNLLADPALYAREVERGKAFLTKRFSFGLNAAKLIADFLRRM